MEKEAQRAEEILSEIREKVQELNKITKNLPYHLRQRFALHECYTFGAVGSPGNNYHSIINGEPERVLRPIHIEVDRAEYREILRKKKMPEPMIWDRWPPHSAEEKAEMYQKLAEFNQTRERSELIMAAPHDEFGHFMRVEARKTAKRLNKEYKDVLTDPRFKEKCREIWEAVDDIVI